MSKNINITTTRLILREYHEDDFHGVHEYSCDPETVKYMTWGPNTPEETRSFMDLATSQQRVIPRVNYHFVILLRKPGMIIGGCGIHLNRPDHRTAAIGYCFNNNYWGKGYATETVGALLHLGFEGLGLHRILGTCDTRNIGSARVMEKNGMRQEALFSKNLWQKGEWRDSYLYAILDNEWQENHL